MPWWTVLSVATYINNGFVAHTSGIGGQGGEIMQLVSDLIVPANDETPFFAGKSMLFAKLTIASITSFREIVYY